MATALGKAAISGIYVGGFVAVAPITAALLTVGSNLFKEIIAGVFLNMVTDGRANTAFNILITSSRLWHLMRYTVPIGCAISAISAFGFYIAEKRLPNSEDFYKKAHS